MQEKLLQFPISLVFFLPLIKFSTGASSIYQFIQLPNVIQMISYNAENTISTSDATGCIPIITANTVGLVFTPSSNSCTTYTKFAGYNTRITGSVFYLRMAGKCGACATSADAKAAIINYVYGQNACPDAMFTYDDVTGYCVGKTTDQTPTSSSLCYCNYASYAQGCYANGTLVVMSRGQATTALNYACQYANSTPSTFNGAWYCYTPFTVSSPTNSYIQNNICGTWVNGGAAIKFIHGGEPGYLSIRIGANAATAMMLSGSTYKYYDGTSIPSQYANWVSGYPRGRALVYLNNNLQIYDSTASTMVRLMCRNPATLA